MLRQGFLRRSISFNSLKTQSRRLDLDPEHYSAMLPMVSFPTPEAITENCALGSDNDTGGYSTALLDHVVEDDIPCLRFSGNLSLHVPIEARQRGMTHSGWAGWRTRPMGANFFNRHPVWDTSLFRFLSLKVKGDNRRYYVNIQTDSLDPIELWQHRLFLRTPGQWETVLIPWADFLRTRNGRISYKKFDGMDREKVKTVGASLIERKEGPFCLHVAEIKSVNTHGFQGPLTRYTKEDGEKFMEEETKRSAEETAAYYAWKRGETPLGTSPTYIPPSPDSTSFSETSSPSSSSTSSHPGEFEPFPNGPYTPETPTANIRWDRHASPPKHLFDDPLFNAQFPSDSAFPPKDRNQETNFSEGGDLPKTEKVHIDEVDLDDQSPEGRSKKMRAMADELHGFSAGQRKEADEREERQAREWRSQGRDVMDHFGQRFEEAPPQSPRRRR